MPLYRVEIRAVAVAFVEAPHPEALRVAILNLDEREGMGEVVELLGGFDIDRPQIAPAHPSVVRRAQLRVTDPVNGELVRIPWKEKDAR